MLESWHAAYQTTHGRTSQAFVDMVQSGWKDGTHSPDCASTCACACIPAVQVDDNSVADSVAVATCPHAKAPWQLHNTCIIFFEMVTTNVVALAHSAASQLTQIVLDPISAQLCGATAKQQTSKHYLRPSPRPSVTYSHCCQIVTVAKAFQWQNSYCDYHEGKGSFGGAGGAPRDGGIHQGGVGSTAPTTGSCILVQRACSCSSLHLASCGWVDGGGIYKQGRPQSSCVRTPAGDSKPLGRAERQGPQTGSCG